jgi:alkylhydroperoxidase family enzyme
VSWLPEQARGETPLDRVFGLRPNLYAAYREFLALFAERRPLDPLLLELCRLLVARIHGCRAELALRWRPAVAAGLSEAKVAALELWSAGPFDDRERACLAFAEMFVRDPHAITDADAAAVARHLGEPGLVALAEALALFDGFARFQVLLGVEPAGEGVAVIDPGKGTP